MRLGRALAALLTLFPCLPAVAADEPLTPARIVGAGPNSGDVLLGALKLGKRQGGVFSVTAPVAGPIDSGTVGGTAITTILGSKAPLASPTFSGTVTAPAFSGGGGGLSVAVSGASASRTLAARAADVLNLLDYVPQGVSEADVRAGTADAAPAFNAAIASRPVGSRVTVVAPFATYRLNSDVGNNGRIVHVDMTSGATAGANYGSTLGAGVLYVTRVTRRAGSGVFSETQGTATSETNVIGADDIVANNGGNSGAGKRFTYNNFNLDNGALPNGGDVAHNIIGRWHQMAGSAFLTWDIGVTPTLPESEKSAANPRGFALVMKEINPIHNGPSTNWTEMDPALTGLDTGVPPWSTMGHTVVPDSWAPTGRVNKHINTGFAVFRSQLPNLLSPAYKPATFSPFHIGNDAVAPGGRGMYFGGNTDGIAANYAYAGVEVRHKWPMFLNLEQAELTSGWIVNAKPGMSYRWATPAGDVTIGATSAGKAVITAPGGIDLPAIPWSAYTPESTGAANGTGAAFGTVTGRYQIAGKRFDVSITIPQSTGGTGNAYVFTALPAGVAPLSDCVLAGAEMNNATNRGLSGRISAGSRTVLIFNNDGSYPGANNARLTINGSCEMQ